ncbi:hypothetical protein [Nostoc sp.]|uniref:hypothetical protein n=1 Tax=Nostoc sp. TaxID=1180 RepID=UPI002FF6E8DD
MMFPAVKDARSRSVFDSRRLANASLPDAARSLLTTKLLRHFDKLSASLRSVQVSDPGRYRSWK